MSEAIVFKGEGPLPSEVHGCFEAGEFLPEFGQQYPYEMEEAYRFSSLRWLGGFAFSQEIKLGCAFSMLRIMGLEPRGKVLSPYMAKGQILYGIGLWLPPQDYPVKWQ